MYTEDEIKKKFAARLRKARRKAGMTRKQLGEATYFSMHTIRNWETEKHLPCILTVCNLAEALGVPVGWLIAGEGKK